MKIISRAEFMRMPAGTVWSYYAPQYFRDLNIKSEDHKEGDVDFTFSEIVGAIDNDGSNDFGDKCTAMEAGASVPMDFDNCGREGLFDEAQLYAIYEEADVRELIIALIDAWRQTGAGRPIMKELNDMLKSIQ